MSRSAGHVHRPGDHSPGRPTTCTTDRRHRTRDCDSRTTTGPRRGRHGDGRLAGIAAEHGLVEPDLGRIASWWHTDSDLGREIEVLTDMNKSRKAGFTESRDSRDGFFRYVERYRAARIIP